MDHFVQATVPRTRALRTGDLLSLETDRDTSGQVRTTVLGEITKFEVLK